MVGNALDVELFLLPVEHALNDTINEAMLRTVTGPVYERLQAVRTDNATPQGGWISKTGKLRKVYADLSPLERLQKRYKAVHNVKLADLEPRKPYINPPWWQPPKVVITIDADTAIKNHDKVVYRSSPDFITIYTDDSGINDRISASAVRMITLPEGLSIPVTNKSADIRPASQFTVYFGELYGLYLALEILSKEPTEFKDERPVIIYTDNQAAIRNAHCPQSKSGQYMVAKIIRMLGMLNRHVEIH